MVFPVPFVSTLWLGGLRPFLVSFLFLRFSNSLFSFRASVYNIIPERTALFGGWDIDCFFLPCGFVEDCLVVLSYVLCIPRFSGTFFFYYYKWMLDFFKGHSCVQWDTYYDDLHTSSLKAYVTVFCGIYVIGNQNCHCFCYSFICGPFKFE